MSNKIKHLEFIQGNVSRLENYCFALKAWSITVEIGFISFLAKENLLTGYLIYTPAFFLILFWVLDSYYLLLGRRFRALYNYVRDLNDDEVDFGMGISNYKTGDCIFRKVFLSKSELLFYFGQIVIWVIIG